MPWSMQWPTSEEDQAFDIGTHWNMEAIKIAIIKAVLKTKVALMTRLRMDIVPPSKRK